MRIKKYKLIFSSYYLNMVDKTRKRDKISEHNGLDNVARVA